MNNNMSPERAGLAAGAIVGILVATLVLLISLNQSQAGFGAVLDAFTAFMVGSVLTGLVVWFVQWGRLRRSSEELAKPGWYDSPEEDGKQWFWSGTRWTRLTRDTPDDRARVDSTT